MKYVERFVSPSQVKPLAGFWKDFPKNLIENVTENWISATLFLGPALGVYVWVKNEQEKERREYLSSPGLAVLPHNYKGIQGKSYES